MNAQTITEFKAKASVRTLVYIYDDNGDLTDPTAIYLTLIDAVGTKQMDRVNISSGGRIGTGIYESFYNTTADSAKGWWQGIIEVIDGYGDTARTSMGNYSFKVS